MDPLQGFFNNFSKNIKESIFRIFGSNCENIKNRKTQTDLCNSYKKGMGSAYFRNYLGNIFCFNYANLETKPTPKITASIIKSTNLSNLTYSFFKTCNAHQINRKIICMI